MKNNPCLKKKSYHIFFTNLANSLKIEIILSLIGKEKNVSKISEELNVEQSKISHALSSLKCCNIVKSKRDGKNRIYYLNKKTIIPILKLIDEHSRTYCKGGCCCK